MTFKPASPADAEAHADWYARPRGAWIGDREFVLLRRLLDPRPGESMLDVGCGTGYFTGRFSSAGRGPVMGWTPTSTGFGTLAVRCPARDGCLAWLKRCRSRTDRSI